MKPVYYHYTEWEDFQSGMYNEIKEGRSERIKKAIELLSNPDLLYQYMTRVANEWTHSNEQTFTNNFNHQAYLGQCACFMYAGVRDNETREAWGYLTNEVRYKANKVADRVYSEWLRRYEQNSGEYQLNLFELMEVNQ